jgi:hypothetical protein
MNLNAEHKEKREHSRVSCSIVGRVKGFSHGHPTHATLEMTTPPVPLKVNNLSLGGAHLNTDHPAKEGEVLRLELHIEGMPENLSALAEVCWKSDTGFGVRFLALPDEDRARLSRFIMAKPRNKPN